MWGGVEAVMALPPLGEGAQLGIALRPAPGPVPVVIGIDGREKARVDGEAGEQRLWLRIPPAAVDRVAELRFTRAAAFPPGGEDQRPLALQLYELRALSPGGGWAGPVAHPWQREAIKVELDGAYGAEEFAEAGEGVWLGPRAVLRAPAGEGRLRFRLWSPRPTPARTTVFVAGRRAAGPLDIGPAPAFFDVEVLAGETAGGRVEVEIVSDPYTPASDGGADHRELGVVLSEIAFEPGN
jgi:DNA-binding transcriptional LysR family regulator